MQFGREKIERLIAQRGFKRFDLEGHCGFSESGAYEPETAGELAVDKKAIV